MTGARSALLIGIVAAGAFGCSPEVSLGEFASDQNGTGVPLPECGAVGEVGMANPAGAGVGVTITYTDWEWSEPFDALEWDVRMEVEPVADGYLWAQEFTLESGNTGLVTMQARGGYQAEPPMGMTDITDIVQFWMTGPPLRAELGDIPFPDARVYLDNQVGGQWLTINARYDLVLCRAYRFNLTREEADPAGGRWYAARISDTETGAETLIGRILAPEAWGRLTTPTRSWTNRIGWGPQPVTCAGPEAAAVLFGMPTANGGALEPAPPANRFAMPPLCPSSRFTTFPNAVRQEVGQLP